MSEATPSTRQEVAVGLELAAEQLVIAVRQLGADEDASVAALRRAWRAL